MVNNFSYIQGSAQALVIIHCPHASTTSSSERGAHSYLLCSQYLVPLGLTWSERGMGALFAIIPVL